jgi:hypothetical protein
VEQLLRYVVEEVPDDAEKKRSFKYDIFVNICHHLCKEKNFPPQFSVHLL